MTSPNASLVLELCKTLDHIKNNFRLLTTSQKLILFWCSVGQWTTGNILSLLSRHCLQHFLRWNCEFRWVNLKMGPVQAATVPGPTWVYKHQILRFWCWSIALILIYLLDFDLSLATTTKATLPHHTKVLHQIDIPQFAKPVWNEITMSTPCIPEGILNWQSSTKKLRRKNHLPHEQAAVPVRTPAKSLLCIAVPLHCSQDAPKSECTSILDLYFFYHERLFFCCLQFFKFKKKKTGGSNKTCE